MRIGGSDAEHTVRDYHPSTHSDQLLTLYLFQVIRLSQKLHPGRAYQEEHRGCDPKKLDVVRGYRGVFRYGATALATALQDVGERRAALASLIMMRGYGEDVARCHH
jgi:hypothetical protein